MTFNSETDIWSIGQVKGYFGQGVEVGENVFYGVDYSWPSFLKDSFFGIPRQTFPGGIISVAVTNRQELPSWPAQMQSGSGASTTAAIFGLVDPYNSEGAAESQIGITSVRLVELAPPSSGEINSVGTSYGLDSVDQAAFSLAEVWDESDSLHFDDLVVKEASGKITLEEATELERLTDKRNRTVARVPDEDLQRERLRDKAISELQEYLEKYAPLFA